MPTETARPEDMTLAGIVSVQRRFLRSVNLERDFYSPDPLDGYLLTASAVVALDRLASGIAQPHARAFSLTGPYGSGKSAFALFASKAMAPASMGAAPLRERLRSQEPEIGRSLFPQDQQGFWPVLITGTREPLAPALRRGLLDALGLLPTPSAKIVRDRLNTQHADLLGEENPSARTVAALYAQAAVFAQEADADCKGLLVIVDEMGKFLEYAAQHPERGDMQVLQEMAEHAVRSAPDAANLVVTVLHQAFEDYGHRLSGIQRAEWQKVQGRFADIAFGDGPEETLRLVAQAIARHAVPHVEERIAQAVTAHMEQGRHIRGFLPASLSAGEFEVILQRTYPLHPLTLRVLPYLFRRFGQNERSLFSFLSSEEPHGFQAFLRQTHLGAGALPILGIDQLYDYVVHTLGATLYAHSSAKLWSEAEEALLRVGDRDPLQARILKVIGLLQILGTQTNLWPGQELLHFALSDVPPDEVDEAIKALLEGTYIVHRRFRDAYRLYEGSDIDVSAELREAQAQVAPGTDAIRLADRTQAIAPIVARRHSYETGTLRFFDVRPCRLVSLEAEITRGPAQGDGLLLLCLVADSVEFAQAESWLLGHLDTHPNVIVGLSRETELLHDAALAVECLLWVKDETPELRNDRVAEREVEERLQEATEAFEAEWGRLLRPQNTAHAENSWYYHGRRESLTDYRQLQALISRACQTAYPQTPRLLNELINRRQLSSTAASARRLLIDAMLTRRHEPHLGIAGFPPEASMYVSLLENTGIHRPVTEQHWDFGPPDPGHEPQLARIWAEFDGLLFRDDLAACSLPEISRVLKARPYGLADGLIPVLLCAVLLHYDNQVAVYEEGRFVTELNSATFERMIKRPEDYRLQGYRISGERADVLGRFAAGLIRDGSEPTLVNVMRHLYRQFNRLPEYTLRTRALAPDAQTLRNIFKEGKEPEQLLFKDLPVLLGVRPFATAQADADNTAQFFARWNQAMTAVMGAYPALLSRIEGALTDQLSIPAWPEIRRRSESIRAAVTEPVLKTFVLRACDGTPDRNQWLESIAAGIVGRPPKTWGDAEEDRFHNLLPPLVSAFQHAELLAFEKGERGADETHVGMRLSVTDDDGTEDARVVIVPRAATTQIKSLSAEVLATIQNMLAEQPQNIRVAVFGHIVQEIIKGPSNE